MVVPKFVLSWPKASASPITVAARYKAQVCDAIVAGTAGSNPSEGMDSVVSCQVEVCTTVRSLVQRSLTEGGVSLSLISKPQP